MYKFGHIQKKVLLAIAGGAALGLSCSPARYFKTLDEIKREWKKIDHDSLSRSIKRLSEERLIDEKILSNGKIKLILTKEGKRQARILGLLGNSMKFKKPKRWDKKWRIVIFDIPERKRVFREILREHLYNLEFKKLQNSVFISPYPFEKIILKLVFLYSAQPYVRVSTASYVDNEEKLKEYFSIKKA